MIPEMEAAMQAEVAEINAQPVAESKPPDLAFVDLAEKCAAAMIQAAELIVNKAQQNLESARLQAQEMVSKARAKGDEVKVLGASIETYGSTMLKAHQTFHNGDKS